MLNVALIQVIMASRVLYGLSPLVVPAIALGLDLLVLGFAAWGFF